MSNKDTLYEIKCCKWITIYPDKENECPVCKSIFVLEVRDE